MAKHKRSFRFVRVDAPPPEGKKFHVIRIGDKETKHMVILSWEIWATNTHWVGRTAKCGGTPKECEPCRNHLRKIYTGFVHVCNTNGTGNGYLELTGEAARRLLAAKAQRPNLRGMIIAACRERGTVKSPLLITCLGDYAGEIELAPFVDPEPTLAALWNVQL